MRWLLLIPALVLAGCATMPNNPSVLQQQLYETRVERDKALDQLADCKEAVKHLESKAKVITKTVYVPVPTRAINDKELEDIKRQAYDDAMEKFKSRMNKRKH